MEYIELRNITKKFGEVVANDAINLSIRKGEVLSILGENGSGKTTLLNVLDGIYQPDGGEILINGEEVSIKSPKDAFTHHIGMVHQHYKLVEAFSAVENIVLGLSRKELLSCYDRYEKPTEGKWRKASIKESARHITMMCEKYGFQINLNKIVADMPVAEKQTLEIIKALFRGIDTLILDEPTAVLTPQETKHLFDVIRNMKAQGKTIIIITHKLNEVLEISDRVVVLRKGALVDSIDTKDASESILADMMVGQKVALDIPRSQLATTGERLVVSSVSVRNKEGRYLLQDATFTLFGSEILGIAGISNSGQKDLLDAISGLAKDKTGEIIFHNPKKNRPVTFFHKDIKQIRQLANEGKFYYKSTGGKVDLTHVGNKELTKLVNDGEILFYEDEIIDISGKTPLEIRNLGIKLSFVPEDRLGMGLVGSMDIVDNMLLRSYRKGRGRLLHKEKPKDLAAKVVEELGVVTPSLETSVAKLSGGNIQKILVGREISGNPKILMVAYPVRGLDIRSSYLIYRLLDEQKKTGTGIIYVGEDLDVMLALTDRILVLCDGKISGIVDSRTATKEEIGLLMGKKEERREDDGTQGQ